MGFLRRRWWLLAGVSLPVGFLAVLSWALTEPLEDRGARALPGGESATVALPLAELPPAIEADGSPAATAAPAQSLAWPETRLEGRPAKELLLSILEQSEIRLRRVDGYTATFRKQERIKGQLQPEQTLAMKVRHRPFAVYLKFLSPQVGKEVVYAEGHHDNKLIAHNGGVARLLIPRLAVPPTHPLALADSRYPVTQAGLANLTTRLVRFRRMDLTDGEAETVLDRVTDAQGRMRYRSVHTHPVRHDDRPFARIEVLYDPEPMLPVDIRSFDWPESGKSGELSLAEHYAYDDIVLDAPLTALDFDPANPAYGFHRY